MIVRASRKRIVLYYPQQWAKRQEPPYCRFTQEMPLALLAIAAWPLRDGYEVVLIDGSRMTARQAHQSVVAACDGALLYATTGILGQQITDGLVCTRQVKARHPRLPAFIGGWFASVTPELQLATGLYDAVALGQGEITFREIVASVDAGEPLDGVAGLALRRNGEVVRTALRAVVGWERLLNLPWSLLDVEAYRGPQLCEPDRGTVGEPFGPGRPRFEISYFSSYGCPHRCTFCCSPQVTGQAWKAMPPERMLDDLAELQQRWGFDGVNFADANFGLHEERARAIAEGMLARGLRFSYFAYLQAASIARFQPSTLDRMAESGLYTGVVGAEAGSQDTIRRIRKPTRGGENMRAASELGRRGVAPLMTYMIGYPGESVESMCATLEEARQIALCCPRVRPEVWPFRPLPGSEAYEEAIREGFQPPQTLEDWGRAEDYWTDEAWPGRIAPDVQHARRMFMFYSSLAQGRVRRKQGFWERRARQRLERRELRFALLEARVFHWVERLAGRRT
ncbi:MAG: B12-binding domain-containing radical SAM protein [Planctomycetes bacterium]|nr:B12-binding domain-containing radical SAM protein [Planctomycetota bacterium]